MIRVIRIDECVELCIEAGHAAAYGPYCGPRVGQLHCGWDYWESAYQSDASRYVWGEPFMAAQYPVFRIACFCLILVTIAPPSFAQNGPTRADFAGALRPIPSSLTSEHRGIPTIAGPAPSASSRAVRASATVARKSAAPPRCTARSDSNGKPSYAFRIAFEFGSAQLTQETIKTLKELGEALNEDLKDQKLFEIEGHTDAVGTFAYNEQLSKQRAEAVRDFLIRETGVAPERLVAAGKGYCELANPKDPQSGENRRAVVINQLR
jgi:outer membrane protein OmpA-like peptidoglycan-associated protein